MAEIEYFQEWMAKVYIANEIEEQSRTMNACNFAMSALRKAGRDLETNSLYEEFSRASRMVSMLNQAKDAIDVGKAR